MTACMRRMVPLTQHADEKKPMWLCYNTNGVYGIPDDRRSSPPLSDGRSWPVRVVDSRVGFVVAHVGAQHEPAGPGRLSRVGSRLDRFWRVGQTRQRLV